MPPSSLPRPAVDLLEVLADPVPVEVWLPGSLDGTLLEVEVTGALKQPPELFLRASREVDPARM